MTFAELKAQIDQQRPPCARVEWQGEGGHFIVLTGYQIKGRKKYTLVEDPDSGQSTYDFQTFLTAYQSLGTCIHSYNTKPV
jgi:hypothetical protein